MTAKHPGQIINQELLHQESKFLKGTGTVTDMSSEVMDTYLHKDKREKMDFEFVNEEIWNFLNGKYGSDTAIKRFYASKGTIYSICEIDCRYKQVPVCVIRSEDLYNGRINDQSLQANYVQIPAKKNFNELKKRLADVVTADL